jgi:hypothetical protein
MTRTRKTNPKAIKKSDEYATFESSLKRVLTVSHEEMQKRIKSAASARASRAKV